MEECSDRLALLIYLVKVLQSRMPIKLTGLHLISEDEFNKQSSAQEFKKDAWRIIKI